MATRTEEVKLSLIDDVSKGLAAIGKSVTGIGASFVKLNAAAQLAAQGIGLLTSAGRAFQGIVQGASDAQFQLAGLQAALGATPEELAKLDAEARRVSETLGLFTKTEVLDALGELGRAGLNASQALETLRPVLTLATGGQVDLALATEQTVKTLAQFGLDASQAVQVANGLVTAANSSATNVTNLGQALAFAGGEARGAGNSLEDTLTVLAALAQTGTDASSAGTALRFVFQELSNEGSKFATALRTSYGITTTNLLEILKQLSVSADGGKAALLSLDREARGAIVKLVQLGGPALEKFAADVTLTGTAAEDATAKLANSYQAALGRITNILTNLRNELATPILGPLAEAFEAFGAQLTTLAQSEDWKLLGQAVADFATQASERLIEFIKNLDLSEAVEGAKAQLQSLTENFEAIAAAISTIASGISVTTSTISTAFNAAVTAVADFSARLVDLGIFLSENIPAYNLLFGEFTETAYGLRDSLRDVAEVRFEKTGESAANLADALGLVEKQARPAAASVEDAAAASRKAATEYDKLFKAIRDVSSEAGLEEIKKQFEDFQKAAGATAEQLDSLDDALFRSTKQVRGLGDEVQPVTLLTEDAAKAFGEAGKEAEDFAGRGVTSIGRIGTAAEMAADDTKRLADAFRNANDAAQFEGALDQFERLKQSGRLTEAQIAEIAKAAEIAGKKFADAGEEGEDGFDKVAKSAERAADAIERSADAAERQADGLQRIFAELDASQAASAERAANIAAQVQAQVDASTAAAERQIEAIQRRISLSREELAVAERLRLQYRLAEQEKLDRLAQLIVRQRELNKEKEEELRLVVASTSAAAPVGGGGTGGANGRPIGTGRQRDTIAPDDSAGAAVPDSQVIRTLARLLGPELARLQTRG